MKLDIVDECLKGTPHDQEVMGSNLVRGWAYSLSLSSPRSNTISLPKNRFLAEKFGAK